MIKNNAYKINLKLPLIIIKTIVTKIKMLNNEYSHDYNNKNEKNDFNSRIVILPQNQQKTQQDNAPGLDINLMSLLLTSNKYLLCCYVA